MSRCHRRSRTTGSPDFQMPHQLCHRLSWLLEELEGHQQKTIWSKGSPALLASWTIESVLKKKLHSWAIGKIWSSHLLNLHLVWSIRIKINRRTGLVQLQVILKFQANFFWYRILNYRTAQQPNHRRSRSSWDSWQKFHLSSLTGGAVKTMDSYCQQAELLITRI